MVFSQFGDVSWGGNYSCQGLLHPEVLVFLASFVMIHKSNLTSQPRTFPIIIAQHIVAPLT